VHRGRGLIVTLGLAAGGLVAVTGPAAPALAGDQVCAGIVIDDGTGAKPVPQGGSVAPGSSDLLLLTAARDTFQQNDSDLVCTINSYPANGLQNCLGTAPHGLYYYWSYWEGDPTTNTWTYANVGPAEHTVAAGQDYVEGWRYQNPGPDSPLATKPSVTPAAAFRAACEGGTTTTTTAPTGTPGSGSPVSTTLAAGSASAPAPTTKPSGATTRGTSGTPGHSGSTVTTTTSSAGGPGPPSTRNDATSSTTPSTTATTQPRTSAQLALSHPGGSRGSGGDPALPILLVVALSALLGIGAWLRWRRTSRGSSTDSAA
jgi:hypothetical protein